MKDDSHLRELHQAYVAMSGLDVPITMARLSTWEMFVAAGHTDKDLRLVLEHVRRLNRQGMNYSLGFRNRIQDLDSFGELLAEAKALARKPKYAPDKARVLRRTGRPDEPDQPAARTPEQIMRDSAALKAFSDFGKNL